MKFSALLLCFWTLFTNAAFAQWSPQRYAIDSVERLAPDELALLHAYRADPGRFRAALDGLRTVARPCDASPGDGAWGPRDLIDVTVEGGKLAFYGKRHEYVPASIRLGRGETKLLSVAREGSAIETQIVVSYRSDGLHFDVPEAYAAAATVPPRGFIVIGESPAWRTGDPILWVGHLDDVRSRSKAQDVAFRIRYVAAR